MERADGRDAEREARRMRKRYKVEKKEKTWEQEGEEIKIHMGPMLNFQLVGLGCLTSARFFNSTPSTETLEFGPMLTTLIFRCF